LLIALFEGRRGAGAAPHLLAGAVPTEGRVLVRLLLLHFWLQKGLFDAGEAQGVEGIGMERVLLLLGTCSLAGR
jgi:hypothetical protein